MKWEKYTINTTTEAEDFVSAMLAELGIEGIEIEDNVIFNQIPEDEQYEELQPELPPDDGTSRVSFYLEEDGENHTETLIKVKAGLDEMASYMEIGSGIIESSETEDLDWINNWKKYFASFTIDDILIKPTWEELKEEDKDKFMIEIDPGISFGTGKHETTQLCIRQLLKYIRGNQDYTSANPNPLVLDIGCGSGILSIVALKLGAKAVVGTDIAQECMRATAENMEVNHLESNLGTFYVGNLIDDKELQEKVGFAKYDIVVANLLADIIIPMTDAMAAAMKPGAYLITSGIINFKEEAVKAAIQKSGLNVLEVNYQGDWVNVTARKPFK